MEGGVDRATVIVTDKEQHEMFDEVFTRLRETEKQSSNLCVRLDNVIEQMKTSTGVTDKFLEALDKRRITDEAREAKFWRVIAILVGALICLALGQKPAQALAEYYFGKVGSVTACQAAIPLHNEKYIFGCFV